MECPICYEDEEDYRLVSCPRCRTGICGNCASKLYDSYEKLVCPYCRKYPVDRIKWVRLRLTDPVANNSQYVSRLLLMVCYQFFLIRATDRAISDAPSGVASMIKMVRSLAFGVVYKWLA
jgi:hypothetical protein